MTIKLQILIGVIAALSLGACASTNKQLLAECGADEACLKRIAEQREEINRRQMQSYLESQDRLRMERDYSYARDSRDAARRAQSDK